MVNEKLLKYIAADSQEKKAANVKKGLRAYVGKLLRRCRRLGIDLDSVSYSEEERYKVNDQVLWEWCRDRVDKETLEYLTNKSIDLEKLQNLYLEGKIDTSTLGEEVFSVTKYFKISVKHERTKKWQKR